MDKLKLFVVGEESGDPSKWGDGKKVLIFAETEDQARQGCSFDYEYASVSEVRPLQAGILYEERPDPHY
ncbi:MAG TPA: hypothetical protein VK395_06760 [Gemmataceae bacterium]|nr:hypothetical protein [Gemmataceae bacterium]